MMTQRYAKVFILVLPIISFLVFLVFAARVPTRKGRIVEAENKATSEQLRSRGPFRTTLDTVAT